MSTPTPSVPKKLLATVVAIGVLSLGGATVASAAETGNEAVATAGADRHHVRRAAVRTAFVAAADTLGMTPRELREALRSGPQSISSVAGDRTAAVTDAIVAALNAKLDAAVANGRITAERADAVRAHLPERAERFVQRVPGQQPA